jgi:hypothetical protein
MSIHMITIEPQSKDLLTYPARAAAKKAALF